MRCIRKSICQRVCARKMFSFVAEFLRAFRASFPIFPCIILLQTENINVHLVVVIFDILFKNNKNKRRVSIEVISMKYRQEFEFLFICFNGRLRREGRLGS